MTMLLIITALMGKGKRITMKEITRFVEVDAARDYVIPAIQINENSIAGYYKLAVHIGIISNEGVVACFCGQNHRTDALWFKPDVSTEPNITCGSCLRTMRNIISASSNSPYRAIMDKLRQKEHDAQFHVRQTNTSRSINRCPPNTDETPRVIGNPAILDSIIMEDSNVVKNVESPVVERATTFTTRIEIVQYNQHQHMYGHKCNLCCFNGPRPCPKEPDKDFRTSRLMCETFGRNAFFMETLVPCKD